MNIEFDSAKISKNIAERHLWFELAADFDFDTAVTKQADRREMRSYEQTPPLIDEDGEVRELTAADIKLFSPAHEVLPLALQKTLGMRPRGPQKSPKKVPTTIRLSPEVMAYFRASGDGWQSRMDGVLREYVARHTRR